MTLTQFLGIMVIIISNVCSGKHGSFKYEKITNIFGFIGVISLFLTILGSLIGFIHSYREYLLDLTYFCLTAAFSRDWEKWAFECKSFFKK